MKQDEISTQRRQQILEATCRCLQNKPYHALTIKEIATEAGISYGLVHFYFDSKDKLLLQITEYVLQFFERALLDIIDPYKDRTLSKEDIFCFFRNWLQLHISPEFAYYIRIWYDISAQRRFIGNADSEAYHTYDNIISEPLGRILSQNDDYTKSYNLITTYMEGMALHIYLYNCDPQKEFDMGMQFLQILLDGIHHS